jgi:hypothetical protein
LVSNGYTSRLINQAARYNAVAFSQSRDHLTYSMVVLCPLSQCRGVTNLQGIPMGDYVL